MSIWMFIYTLYKLTDTVTVPPLTTSPSPTTQTITQSPEIEANAVQMTLPGFTVDTVSEFLFETSG